MPRPIPYAVANYEEIVDGGYHFVDKTRFIRELEGYKTPSMMRPRRFGKSLWCSILECYYDINRAQRFDTLFGQTAIGRDPTPAHNTQLVLRFDFSKVVLEANYEQIRLRFDTECANSMLIFAAEYQERLGELRIDEEGDATTQLSRLLRQVKIRRAPPVLILIDEYDNFTNQLLTTRQDHLYEAVTTGDSFLRTFYKVIKAGVGDGTVARCFITGVLPVTLDDLTSGFNIAQVISLENHTLAMMGFTQDEVDTYVDAIFDERDWSPQLRAQVRMELRAHYNGYRLLPGAEALYNATICNHYLNRLVIDQGRLPTDRIDENLRVDLNWLRRLTGSNQKARELVEGLMFQGRLPVDLSMLQSKFNVQRFTQEAFFPLSLYYLGMVTFADEFSLVFPNLTMKTIFTEYFNELAHIEVSLGYTDMFSAFVRDHDWTALFAGYWRQYVGQIPAQAFDRVNENFFRTTFYELCTRYLSRHLSFAIEVNRRSGRSDFEAIGRAGTAFTGQAWLGEFKHIPRSDAQAPAVAAMTSAAPEDVEQVSAYAEDLAAQFPELRVHRFVVYTIGAQEYRFFALD